MKTSLVTAQLLTLAVATLPTVAPRLSPEHVIAALFAIGLGCLLRADYARRSRPFLAASLPAAPRPASESLTLAA